MYDYGKVFGVEDQLWLWGLELVTTSYGWRSPVTEHQLVVQDCKARIRPSKVQWTYVDFLALMRRVMLL